MFVHIDLHGRDTCAAAAERPRDFFGQNTTPARNFVPLGGSPSGLTWYSVSPGLIRTWSAFRLNRTGPVEAKSQLQGPRVHNLTLSLAGARRLQERQRRSVRGGVERRHVRRARHLQGREQRRCLRRPRPRIEHVTPARTSRLQLSSIERSELPRLPSHRRVAGGQEGRLRQFYASKWQD